VSELDLYKFITDNNVEYHWNHDNTECWMMPSIYLIEDFNKLLPKCLYDEDGVSSVMKDNYFCFEMVNICESCDIEPEKIFEKDKEF
jgi:hypothetical protein